MKKFKIYGLVLLSCFILALIVSIAFQFIVDSFMFNYFDDWSAETESQFAEIKYGSSVKYLDGEVSFGIMPDTSSFTDVLVVYCNRIYISCTKHSERNQYETWILASTDLSGNDYLVHYESEFYVGLEGKLLNLTQDLYTETPYLGIGCYYYDDKIVFQDIYKAVEYNLQTQLANEFKRYDYIQPESEFYIGIDADTDSFVFENKKNSCSESMSLQDMAEKNMYAQSLLNLAKQHRWDGKSKVECFFQKVRVIEDHVYIIGEVRNFHGDAFGIVFEYLPYTDGVVFVDYEYIGDSVFWDYDLVAVVDVES